MTENDPPEKKPQTGESPEPEASAGPSLTGEASLPAGGGKPAAAEQGAEPEPATGEAPESDVIASAAEQRRKDRRLRELAERYRDIQEPLPAADPDRPATWQQDIFTTSAWHRHLVFFIAAMALATAALWFYYAAETAELYLDFLHTEYPWLLFILLPLGFMAITVMRDKGFPGTQGTGIPQTIASLRMRPDLRDTVLSFRIAIGKVFLTTLGLFSGASIGREGPSVHVGACFMHICQRFARFPKNLTDRGLILGGGAAGIAASFNAPFAGIVFACEEIGRSFEKENMGTIIRTVAIACLAVIAALNDNYLFYGTVKTSLFEPWQWLIAIPVIGIIGGFLGGCFSQLLKLTMPIVARIARQHGLKVAATIGLVLAGVAMISGGESIGSGFLDARAILQGEDAHLSPLYPFYRALVTFITLLSGIPGGLFDPTLSTGAGLGKNMVPIFELIGPINPEAVVMMAMVAYFTGVVQSPITSMVIMVEMTAAVTMSLPLLAVAIIAYEVSRKICPTSLYESIADEFLAARRQQLAEEEKARQKASQHLHESGGGI
ncbi:MAG: chloride channel protein [Verrucomicrobiota bacterium]